MAKQTYVALLTIFLSLSTMAAPNLNHSKDFEPDRIEKRILEGDSEITPDAALGYSSYSGLIFDSQVAYRYFFFDKVSLGGILGYGYSENSKRYKAGLTGRWYFLETNKWAFSLTQDIVYNRNDFDIPNLYRGSSDSFNSSTRIGAHYFFNPNVSLEINLGYDSGFSNFNDGAIVSRVGLGFNF